MQDTELRPLGAGELLDRAVTLFVRRFPAIVATLAVAVVPLLILDALLEPNAPRVYGDMLRVLTSAGDASAERAALAVFQADGAQSSAAMVSGIADVVVHLLELSAVVAVVAAAAAGTQLALGPAYALALRLWPRQLLVGLGFLAIGVLAAIPLLLAYLLMFALVLAVGALTHATSLALVFFAVTLAVWFACAAALSAWVFMAYNLAAVAVVTEGQHASSAIGAGLRRAFRRPTALRTLLAGVIVGALSFIGSFPIVVVSALVAAFVHVTAVYFAVVGVGQILLEGLITSFVVVYAADVRLRREGLDLVPSAPG